MYDEDEEYDENYRGGMCDVDWEEETWYALTDGQYGDYPGEGFDYDILGF